MAALVNNISMKTLQIILGGVTIVGGSALYWKSNSDVNKFYKSKVIVEAIEIAKKNNELRTLLGEPIKGGIVDVKDKRNYLNETNGHFEIPLLGKQHNCTMLVDIGKYEQLWELDNVNIEFRGKEEIIGRINLFKRS